MSDMSQLGRDDSAAFGCFNEELIWMDSQAACFARRSRRRLGAGLIQNNITFGASNSRRSAYGLFG
jgi:hypothetical protein